jgi:SH3-like domain-containing protein
MPKKSPLPVLAGLLVLAFASGSASFALGKVLQKKSPAEPGEITNSIGAAGQNLGGSTKLPLPRFVSVKADRVNVRRGPSSEHPVAFVFQRKGLPVEITAEFENWRKVRDSDGAEGWVLHSMLTGRRIAAWSSGICGTL